LAGESQDKAHDARGVMGLEEKYESGRRELDLLFFGGNALQELRLHILDRLGQGFFEFFEVFLVQENLMLFVFVFADTLAFRYRDIEIFLRFCRFHVEEVRAFACPDTFREDLVFVPIVIQGTSSLVVVKCLLN
jgi:hypothetical protein